MTSLDLLLIIVSLTTIHLALKPYVRQDLLLLLLNLFLLVSIGTQGYQALTFFFLLSVLSYVVASKGKWIGCVAVVNIIFFCFLRVFHNDMHWSIPLGYAFYALRVLSFLFDVQNGKLRRTDVNFLAFFNYVYFFSTLISGPIVKAADHHIRSLSSKTLGYRVHSFSVLFGLGVVKKFVIADNLRVYVDYPIQNPVVYEGWPLIIAVLLSKWAIYVDFAGYSDMARGIGRLMGVSLPQNFSIPFRASNLRDYWRRWHASLSKFIHEYVFVPLALSPFRKFGLFGILVITYLILALWHNFTWPFVLYGVVQAALLYFDSFLFGWVDKCKSITRPFFRTFFLYFVLLALPSVLFRVTTLEQFFNVLVRLNPFNAAKWGYFFNLGAVGIFPLLAISVAVEAGAWKWTLPQAVRFWQRQPYVLKVIGVLFLSLLFVYYVNLRDSVPFIYSRF